jgi:hypothetical protein
MSHASQHSTHTDQHTDHAAWLADILNWRIDHVRALSTLAKVESLLKQHEAKLAEHELLVRGHDRANIVQEALMAKAEQGSADLSSADADSFLGKVHAQQAAAHAAIREHHLELMARVLELQKALEGME